jgi:hypothetical protein
MRKIMMIVTLAISWLAVSATLNASIPTPECSPNCVLVR